MTPAVESVDVERFRAIVARRFGLAYDERRLDDLADVLRRRMEATGSPRFGVYVEHLASSEESRVLAERLTVGETFFFRNADNFRALVERVLPERLHSNRAIRRLRMLSAGCASGEEPYSLAVAAHEAVREAGSWDVGVDGIDVNGALIAKAREARYAEWSLRATPEEARRRYFHRSGRDLLLDPEIQRLVTFEERNLVDADPLFWQRPKYDVVFCRNVLMYLTPDAMREVVGRLCQVLLPGGYLFLGHAETLRGLSQNFHLCHTHGTFYYRRRAGVDSSVSGPEAPCDEVVELLPAVLRSTTSWVDAIRRSSERIAALAGGPARVTPGAPPANGPPPVPVDRASDLRRVLEAMQAERFAEALELLTALPADAERTPEALLVRAVLLTNSGRLGEAEMVCDRLLAVDDLNAGAHYVMALCREHAGDAARAIDHDQIAIHLDAGFAMPHLHLGLVAKRTGDGATARRALEQARSLLTHEDGSRLLMFGGGFSRDTLRRLCRTELSAIG
jgi:chemotaxis protein methyltransferase CheR